MEQELAWVKRNEPFTLRFGRYSLKTFHVASLSLQTHCTSLPRDLAATLSELPPVPPDCDAVVLPAHPIEGHFPRLKGFFGPVIQYISKAELRYLIPLRGTFEEYASGFSGRRRSVLTRHLRKFTEFSAGSLAFRVFTRPEEMPEFVKIAAALSQGSYKAKIGATFEDLAITPEELSTTAARDAIRGYVLSSGGKAVAYYFCREQSGSLLYVHSAYDPSCAKLSPGTVLLWLILESLFAEQRFEYFDFLWGYYPYKKAFARTSMRVACVITFRGSSRNRALVLTHLALWTLTKWMRALTPRLRLAGLARRLGEKLIHRA
jgi:hypothetical protein